MAAIQFPHHPLGPGQFTAIVKDNNGEPSSVLEAGEKFEIRCEWKISRLAALLLGGRWKVAAYVESIGPGPEKQIGLTKVVALNGGTEYHADIEVPAHTLPDLDPHAPAPEPSGAYKLVTLLTLENFGKLTDVAAVVEGPVLRIG
ncbi:hypothetical protein [Actinoplanes sp. NPDC020271]|uniref:hypothetical protein n=1 Tax=Actinoplanes sp. NPDC020271 TaxID=3363896 RepID=UPI0037B232CC